jgi:hypothetical protein
MSVPPELMALLQGGGAGGGDPMAAAGAPEEAAQSPMYGGGGLGGDNTEALRAALDSLAQYAQGEDDEQNIQTVLKCVTALQAILADEQKMVDGAMGGKADPRAMRRLSGPAGGGEPTY